ncbi:Glycoside Hydrolase Family 5 protein [Gigaspora rosea]|uniref:Glycoside Hydrolase Family 5 protein n=1 Tax=Gigaspora rosea TaxID=44941 RepID=A0A397W4L8_9GLOM|nr:Glycoside Hydrolase Family 5 protein [Gigaspora rosea]
MDTFTLNPSASTAPEISVDSEVASISDSDSSDEISLANKSSCENLRFRPSHHHLSLPELKRSASVSSLSSYASTSPGTPTRNNKTSLLTEENLLALGESGALAHNWYSCGGGSIHADGRWFKDEQGRTCMLRGVNLCGNSKLPTKPDGSSHLIEGFFDHRNVSFVGRPFPLEDVHEHFSRLRTWGLTFVRLLVPWEALEHAGPGIYDEEFIDYLINVINEMPRYGIKCFIDPHQDCWSRFSGGSGAPGWTFEVAGLNLEEFKATGAAYVHNTHHSPGEPPLPMVWPTNYTKLASSTMFTLFWGGDVFAPETKYEGINVKDFLQEKYINCYKYLAKRIQHLDAVMGFELMNEPHPGYIGLSNLLQYDAGATLVFGDSPNALQSFALGAGIPQEIEVWVRSWPFPTRKQTTRIVNTECKSAWINNQCIWQQHGVWGIDTNTLKPKVLIKDYFMKHPKTGDKLNFYKDFYLPFVNKYSEAIQSVRSDYYVFVEPLPNEPPPKWTPEDHHKNLIYAPHWYDLKSLFTKTFDGMITHDVQRLTRGAQHIVSATYFGISGAKKNYFGQVRNIIKDGLKNVGNKPCVIGECGIPMDINDKKAFETGDYTHHSNFLDAVLGAMEKNLVNFTLWNYNPLNDNIHGDHWYGEDFSIYSPPPFKTCMPTTPPASVTSINVTNEATVSILNNGSPSKLKSRVKGTLKIQTFQNSSSKDQTDQIFQDASEEENPLSSEIYVECENTMDQMSPTSPTSPFDLNPWQLEQDQEESHHAGGRVLDAVLRPYAAKIAGIPHTMIFNLKTKEFTFKFTNYPASQRIENADALIVAPETEIYIPSYHYKKLNLDIRVSDGDWRYVKSRQTLYWRVKDWMTEGVEHTIRIRGTENTATVLSETSGSIECTDINKKDIMKIDERPVNTKWILGAILILIVAILPFNMYWWLLPGMWRTDNIELNNVTFIVD